jgi:hypothetical protein
MSLRGNWCRNCGSGAEKRLSFALRIFLHIQIFCTAKNSEALQKVAKMPETTRNFGYRLKFKTLRRKG